MPPETNVSLTLDLPEELHERVQDFLNANPTWSYEDFVTSALSMLLLQLGDNNQRDARIYLDRQFYRLWGKTA